MVAPSENDTYGKRSVTIIEPGKNEPVNDAKASVERVYITRQSKELVKMDNCEELEKLYAPKDNKFNDYETMERYLAEINKTMTDLASTDDTIEDGNFGRTILCGLSEEWDTVVSALCNLPEEFNSATVK